MSKEFFLKACVVLLCGTGLLMLIPVTLAVVLDFIKGIKKAMR